MELKARRNSNIELLRIIAMAMIIAHHCALYGFFPEEVQYSSNKWIVDLLFSYGKVGVSIFVLITGYYMTEQGFRVSRALRIAGQVWFYSLCGLAVVMLIPDVSLEKNDIVQSFFPIVNGQYWFASTYLFIILLSPAINVFVHNAGRMLLQGTMAVLIIACLALPTLFGKANFYSPICWFTLLYITGSYIRLWRQDAGRPEKHFTWAVLWALTIPMYAWGGNILSKLTGHIEAPLMNSPLNRDWSITGYVAAVEFFEWARSRQPKYRPWINRVAGCAFGVYLFHENQFVREFGWPLSGISDKIYSRFLPLWAAMAIIAMYAAGSVVDLVRQKTVGRLWDRAVGKLSPRLEQWGSSTLQKLADRIDRSA